MVIITTNTHSCQACGQEVQTPAALPDGRKVNCQDCSSLLFNRPRTIHQERADREAILAALGTPDPMDRIIPVDSCPSFSYRNYPEAWNRALEQAERLGKTEALMDNAYSKDGAMLKSGAWAL